MTNDEKREMIELMRQVVKEEIAEVVNHISNLRSDTGSLKTSISSLKADIAVLKFGVSSLYHGQPPSVAEQLQVLESRVDRLETQLVKLLEER